VVCCRTFCLRPLVVFSKHPSAKGLPPIISVPSSHSYSREGFLLGRPDWVSLYFSLALLTLSSGYHDASSVVMIYFLLYCSISPSSSSRSGPLGILMCGSRAVFHSGTRAFALNISFWLSGPSVLFFSPIHQFCLPRRSSPHRGNDCNVIPLFYDTNRCGSTMIQSKKPPF